MTRPPFSPERWQPIETAPKEKGHQGVATMVLLASTSGHRAIGYWAGGLDRREGWVNPHDHRVMDYWNAFTHWMPLPPPPKATE